MNKKINEASDFGDDDLSQAKQRYFALRRKYWRFTLISVLMTIGVLFPFLYLEPQIRNHALKSVIAVALVFTLLPLWIASIFMQMLALIFLCPRCGKRFNSIFSNWPGETCKNCKLDLG